MSSIAENSALAADGLVMSCVPHRQDAYVPTGARFCTSSTARLIAVIMLSGCDDTNADRCS